ncbi:MAG: hypothetical protein Q8M17_06715 [Actinomycetota bacterium]|nr:hypothetical protein [Actinomycetota bacterium]
MRTRGQGRTDPVDGGVAIVIVLIWSAVLLISAAAVGQVVLNQVRPSDRSEKSFAAWAAAESGVEDIRAHLAADADFWKDVRDYYADPTSAASIALVQANPALAGWEPVPDGEGEFTYWLDVTNAQRTGRIIVSSTGRDGTGSSESVRTVEAELQKRTSNEYAYLSNSEAYPYDEPGVYGPVGSTSSDGIMSRSVADVLCGSGGSYGRHDWFQWTDWAVGATTLPLGPARTTSATNPAITAYGPHRNSYACLFGSVSRTDRWYGAVHTNDVWYLDPAIANIDPFAVGQAGQVFNGAITSSCPSESAGSTANGTCRENHRWISTTTLGGSSQWGKDPTTYVADEIPNIAGENDKLWNPTYEPPLEMPSEQQLVALKALAAADGCVFTGPTRIRMRTVAGAGQLIVTSPDTADTASTSNAFCGGTSLRATNVNAHPTIVLNYSTMTAAGFNGVIYVEHASAETTSAPSCATKSSGSRYPFVIPNASLDAIAVVNGTPVGLPSAETAWSGDPGPGGKIDEWTDAPATHCWWGSTYILAPSSASSPSGYTGQYTIAADGDIVLTDDVLDSQVTNFTSSSSGWGIPPATSTSQLGLVPKRFLYVYHLDQQAGGYLNGINTTLSDLILNFAILAPNKCLTVQDFKSQPQMETLKIVGSIGQDSRCRMLGDSSGYTQLSVVYDERLRTLGPPPYMAELSLEPWSIRAWSETDVRRDVPARGAAAAATASQPAGSTVTYPVTAAGAPAGSTLVFARLTSGSGTMSVVGSDVRYAAPNGVTSTVIEVVVDTPTGARVGFPLTITVS